MIRTKTTNPKCAKCAKQLNGHCTARTYKECPLANIQSAFAQFAQLVECQSGKTPEQRLLTAVLNQSVLDSVHMYKPRGQANPREAVQFIHSKLANGLCKACELDHEWFIEMATAFILGVKRGGLKSIGAGRAERNAIKRELKKGNNE